MSNWSVGKKIRALRKEKGLTQKELSARSGIAEITIRQYEAGKYIPKMETLSKLCIALKCKPDDILDEPFLSMDHMEEIIDGILIPKDLPLHLKQNIKEVLSTKNDKKNKHKQSETTVPFISDELFNIEIEPKVSLNISIAADEDHPFYILHEKIKNGESLTPDDKIFYEEYMKKILSSARNLFFKELGEMFKQSFFEHYSLLNDAGKTEADRQINKALKRTARQVSEQIEMLIKIPEYRKDSGNQ